MPATREASSSTENKYGINLCLDIASLLFYKCGWGS
jgi:hypothetical protein